MPTKLTNPDLGDAHDAAYVLTSERFRPYLPGRLLRMLTARFRDDAAEAPGTEPPPLPRRRPARLDDLTDSEFGVLWDAVDAVAERFAARTDDPELARLLMSLRKELATKRAHIAAGLAP